LTKARLHGDDHRELGEIATISQGSAAIVLSRGGAPKQYAYREPNEDAVGYALSEWGTVAVIADGHGGCEAANVCIDRVLDTHAARWLAAAPIALESRFASEAIEVVFDTNTAIVQASIGAEADGSRTTLAAVLIRPRDGWMAVLSVGDSHVFRSDAEATWEIAAAKGERVGYLGEPAHTPERLAAMVRVELMPTAAVRAVVLATDGLSEKGIGVADPAATVAQALHEAALAAPDLRAHAAAQRIVDRAMESHRSWRSGDNVACSVVWVE
jgi:serine/threonine protein phosphatase PrpC